MKNLIPVYKIEKLIGTFIGKPNQSLWSYTIENPTYITLVLNGNVFYRTKLKCISSSIGEGPILRTIHLGWMRQQNDGYANKISH